MIVLTRTGRRDSKVAGIFSNCDKATKAAHRFIAEHEKDNYHRYNIHQAEIDFPADWFDGNQAAAGPTLGEPVISMMRSVDDKSVLYVFHKTGNVAHFPI